MMNVISIILNFWEELFSAFNSHLIEIGLDLKGIELTFYEGNISLYNYFVLLASLLTILFVVYLTYRFFLLLYKLVVSVWTGY